jgi:class 3 adenylate cyclase
MRPNLPIRSFSCFASIYHCNSGLKAIYLGRGDLHDPNYDHMKRGRSFLELANENVFRSEYTGLPLSDEYCIFYVTMYPSTEMEKQFTTSNPVIFAAVSVIIFLFTSIIFLLYDTKVEQRQKLVMTTAVRTTHMLSSLFPSAVRDKLLQESDDIQKESNMKQNNNVGRDDYMDCDVPSTTLDSNININNNPINSYSTVLKQKFAAPIADLYPDTTVFFADICGFTAWSSSRGPDHVFILLESLYSEFDKIARRRKVFKVETIGDSYVAVVGLPEPMKNHATVMVKFAEDVLLKMKVIANELITCFGPDTAHLNLRVGLNSGPTTAGVIRGEKSRFQLFGDTVNTASRMESTGSPGRIQCSPKTAELLQKASKGHWLTKRHDVVRVKGKGEMTTFWVHISRSAKSEASDHSGGVSDSVPPDMSPANLVRKRLVDWNFDLFENLLLDVMSLQATRILSNELQTDSKRDVLSWEPKDKEEQSHRLPLEEVVEVLDLQNSDWNQQVSRQGESTTLLGPTASQQLKDLITSIASLYRPNPFHNFEHASHVVMSTKNLLDRLNQSSIDVATHQIRLDPLVCLAIVFGALVHDIDHVGIPNIQLTKDRAPIAVFYRDRCIAEQNSFDVAWKLFMGQQFADLRRCIFRSENDYNCFRQVTLNIVMATDIFDTDLKTLRQSQWDKVFNEDLNDVCEYSVDDYNRKATLCVEHLIQASDIIHTMQHWTVYQNWNRKLFEEMNIAYQEGRLEKNPCLDWFEDELLFFDNYIIPLAKKLTTCDMFGVNSEAFLNFAIDNRGEWETKGRSIVNEWIKEMKLDCEEKLSNGSI